MLHLLLSYKLIPRFIKNLMYMFGRIKYEIGWRDILAFCPILMIDKFYEDNVDYLSNTLEPTFPDGLDIEILKQGVLEKLATFELEEKELEHVTYGIYNRPEIFNLSNFFS